MHIPILCTYARYQRANIVWLALGARLTPVIYTRSERGNAAGTTCTETQSTNERRVGGWPRSFCTTDGRESLAVGTVAHLMPHDHQEKTTDRRRGSSPRDADVHTHKDIVNPEMV